MPFSSAGTTSDRSEISTGVNSISASRIQIRFASAKACVTSARLQNDGTAKPFASGRKFSPCVEALPGLTAANWGNNPRIYALTGIRILLAIRYPPYDFKTFFRHKLNPTDMSISFLQSMRLYLVVGSTPRTSAPFHKDFIE